MTEPWTYDHIHEPPPPGQVNKDRVALAVVMLGVGFGFGIEAVKEVVVRIRGRLKRRKQDMRP